MKPTTRRLGRGLGAFLDFGPAGEDGPAFRSESFAAEGSSILETSSVPVATSVPVGVRPAAEPVAPLAPEARAPAPLPPPPADESPFVDDLVAPLSFPDVELE